MFSCSRNTFKPWGMTLCGLEFANRECYAGLLPGTWFMHLQWLTHQDDQQMRRYFCSNSSCQICIWTQAAGLHSQGWGMVLQYPPFFFFVFFFFPFFFFFNDWSVVRRIELRNAPYLSTYLLLLFFENHGSYKNVVKYLKSRSLNF